MRLKLLLRGVPFLAAGVLASASVGACAHRNDIYDVGNNDYHRWDSREDAAYRRWEAERSVQHVEYARRTADEQRTYWTWRHAHPG
jgi:hypothetical protein